MGIRHFVTGACALLAILGGVGEGRAQTLSAITQFSADASGAFSGGQAWNTRGGDAVYNLYVEKDTPPLLNSGNAAGASISVPLVPGTYTYYLYAEQGGLPSFPYAGVNLFFDGQSVPGISAYAPVDTSGGSPNGSASTADLDGNAIAGANTLTATVGGMTVTLSNFLFTSLGSGSPDVVSAFNNAPSGATDFVASFTLTVRAATPPAPVPAQSGPMIALLAALVALLAAGSRRLPRRSR